MNVEAIGIKKSYYSNCLNLNFYSSWLNIYDFSNISKFSQLWKYQEAGYYWDVGRVINFETNGINDVIIPVDSLFVVLQTSQSFQTFKKLETWI